MTSSLWIGPSHAEARAAFARAREAGFSGYGALVIGNIGSFKDGWAFRRTIAKHIGCCVRTVQRWITRGKEECLIGVARAKKGEIPHGVKHPFDHGFSHRWTIGWGLAGEAVKRAVETAKGLRLVRMATAAARVAGGSTSSHPSSKRGSGPKPAPSRTEYQMRKWTPEELEAELDRLERLRAPPD